MEKLLDRTKEEEGEGLGDGSKVQNDYLNSFKVASYAVAKEGETPKEKSGGESFWDKLLKDGYAPFVPPFLSSSSFSLSFRNSTTFVSYLYLSYATLTQYHDSFYSPSPF